MGIALSGLASGFDWNSVVTQLVDANRVQQNRMRTEKTSLSQKSSALNDLKGLLSSLKSSVSTLATKGANLDKATSFSDTATKWTASASSTTPVGNYSFKFLQAATASTLDGSAVNLNSLDGSALLSDLPIGRTINSGTFSINGKSITISTASSLDDVLDQINTETGNAVSATIVAGKIELTSASPITLGASSDTSNFLLAMRLSNPSTPSTTISSDSALTSLSLGTPLSVANFTNPIAASGSFSVNGKVISYTSSSTLQDVLNSINSSEAGVTATFDASSKKFTLTNKNTGDLAITVEETSGNLATEMGLTSRPTTFGKNAEFSLNGGPTITSRSNTLDSSAHGITGLSVTAVPASTLPETQTIKISNNSTSAKDALTDFVTKYNAVQNAIEKYTKVTSANGKVTSSVLSGDYQIAEISRSLRKSLYESGAGVSGSVQRMSDLGVTFSGIEATVTFSNTSLLDSKLSSSASDVSDYLNTSSTGLITRLNKVLDSLVSDSGSAAGGLKSKLDSITKQDKSLDTQITNEDRRLATLKETLTNSFLAMEKAQSSYQQQGNYISKTYN